MILIYLIVLTLYNIYLGFISVLNNFSFVLFLIMRPFGDLSFNIFPLLVYLRPCIFKLAGPLRTFRFFLSADYIKFLSLEKETPLL